MTDDRQPTDWPDERLAEAFLARAAARPTPPDLAAATLERVRHSSPRSTSRPRLYSLGALAAAAAIVVTVIAIAIGRPVVEPGQSPSMGPVPQVLSVAEAIAIRDADPTDREIAVRGYFSPARADILCPLGPTRATGSPARRPAANPIRLDCPLHTQWLLDSAERLVDASNVLPADRAGFQVVMPFLDTSRLDLAAHRERLVEVVIIGHFHDRRGHPNLCGTGSDADCDGFVVDGIRSVGGEKVPASTLISLEPYPDMPRHEPVWTPADVDRLLLAAAPDFEILSRVALPGHRIRELEPALGTGALGIIDQPIAWVVTGLDAGAAGAPVRRTFLLVDDTAEAYETVPGDVDNVGFVPFALVPLPLAPSPSPTSTTLDLVDHDGRHLSVEIVDESGLLVSAAPVPPGTPLDVPTPGNDVAVSQVAGQLNAIRLGWVGGVCDGPMRFTIRPDGRTIFQEARPSGGDPGRICIAVGISRSLTLTFSEPVPASEVEIATVPAQDSPAPSESPTVSTIVGDPITVSEALERLRRNLDDTEIAVRGFVWSPPDVTCQISLARPKSPLLPLCPAELSLLADGPQPVSADPRSDRPVGLVLEMLIGPETYVAAAYVDADSPSVDSPEVIVLGHFDDHRAAQCPAEQIESCRRTFVVDALLDAEHPGLDLNAIEDMRPDRYIETVATTRDAVRIATAAPGRAVPVLTAFAIPGTSVASIEPQAAESSELTSAAAVWIVRYVDVGIEETRPVLKTKLIIDGPVTSLGRWIYIPSPDGLLREITIID